MASAKKAKPVVKRLGRPRDTSSVDTKQRILVVAREMFSVHGYEITTNRDIATAVGITPGALYHYFGSKLALYLAVHEDTQTQVYEQFTKAIIGHESFIGQFEAVLDIAHEMNIEDASVARFIGAVRVDSGRHPDMAAATAVILSCAIPFVFTKAMYDDALYIDGAFFDMGHCTRRSASILPRRLEGCQ
jgi:AcrR family transcriptional regulator